MQHILEVYTLGICHESAKVCPPYSVFSSSISSIVKTLKTKSKNS